MARLLLPKGRQRKDALGAEGKEQGTLNSPLPPCSHAFFTGVHTPLNKDGSNNWGGVDTDKEDSTSWWERVKYYAQLAIERVEYGVDAVKELLSTLTSDERCGVMLKFEDINQDLFAQLVADAPDWVEWIG